MEYSEGSLFIFKTRGIFEPCLNRPFTLRLSRLLLALTNEIVLNDLLLKILLLIFPGTSWVKIPTPPNQLS